MDSLLVRGWLLVVGGAVLLAVGGALTTYGWNTLADRSSRRALIRGVMREWEINERLFTTEPLFQQGDSTAHASRALYPLFRLQAVNNLLASGLFAVPSAADGHLLALLLKYQTKIQDLNARLEVSNGFISGTSTDSQVAEHRTHLLSSAGFKVLRQEHDAVGRLIAQQFPWANESGIRLTGS